MPSNFKTLAAYQRSRELADAMYDKVVRWDAFDRETLGLQLIRAVDSISANIAEAGGRWTAADKRRLLTIARGSLYETEHWIETAKRRSLLDSDFTDELAGIARPLNGLIKEPTP